MGSDVQQDSLTGRDAEISALGDAYDAARTGIPTQVLIEGPGGIGKTALIRHFLADPARAGARTVTATGVDWESTLPFRVAEALAHAGGGVLGLPTESGAAARCDEAGRQLHAAWHRLQERQPVVVVVDDAHWADVESLRAARSALRRMSTERVLLVFAADDDVDVQLPAATVDFLAGMRDQALALGPLSPPEVKELAHRTDRTVLSLATARHLTRHTGGNPLHITRLLAELPRETWQDWRPALPAPQRYRVSVLHRLDRCGEAAGALVRACSVFEGAAPLAEAAALAELEGVEAALAALDEAVDAGLLTMSDSPGRTVLGFPHPLLRAAVLESLGPLRRNALHRRAALTVEGHGRQLLHKVAASTGTDAELADELSDLAVAYAGAGEWATVSDLLVKAGRLSTDRASRQTRLLRAVDAMVGAGDMAQAVTFAPELESFPAHTLRDAVLAYLAIMRGRPAEAEALLARAWERCDPVRQPDLAATICQRQVLHSLARWDGNALVTWARRALELVDPADPAAVESEAIMGLGLAAQGHTSEAIEAYESAYRKAGEDAQKQRFEMGRGWVDIAMDEPEEARRRLEAAVPTSFRMGSTRISLWAQGWLARTQFAMGSWTEALDTTERAAARLEESPIALVQPLVHWTGAQVHALRGEWEAADHHVELASADVHRYEVMLLPSALARAQVAEARGEYGRVIEALTPVARLRRRDVDEPGFWPWAEVYANALVMVQRAEEADLFLRPYEDLARARGHRSSQARLGLARGRVAGAEGDIDAARGHFEHALAHLQALPLPYDRARVYFAYGQTLRRAGKRREADAVLKNARDIYRNLGAHTYVQRCERELQAGGLHADRDAAGTARLTAQERAVAKLVARGLSNQDTAQDLFVSVKTVQYHLTHVYAKLGVRSRSELAAQYGESLGADDGG